jgi:hypothetical protein
MKILRGRLALPASLPTLFALLVLLLAPALASEGTDRQALHSVGAHFCAAGEGGDAPAGHDGRAHCCLCCNGRFDDLVPGLVSTTPDDAAASRDVARRLPWGEVGRPLAPPRQRLAWLSRAPPSPS